MPFTPQPNDPIYDAIILGAGAAGLMCALQAGRRGRRILLIDHADRPGKKILISGGGRCNFTNLHTRPENFLSQNPHFAKSALSSYAPADFLDLVDQHQIPWHEKTLGQLFCDRTSHDIVNLLTHECAQAGVTLQLGTRILSVTHDGTQFKVETSNATLHTPSVVVATGGLSIPKMGATGLGYEIAQHFNLEIVPCRPALVPFVFNPEDTRDWADLSGLSAEVIATNPAASPVNPPAAKKQRTLPPAFREKLLITHRGLSGPAILQASSYWQPGHPISLDLAPGQNIAAPLLTPHARRDPTAVYNELRNILPARMAERWLTLNLPPQATQALRNSPANDALPTATLITLEQRLHDWRITPAGTEGYVKAEVTAGGVSTDELDAKTMQSKKRPNLYFIGEVVDVTGWLGGYNFQWAWASAHAAAQAL